MSSLVTMRMNDVSIHARSTSSLLDWREGDQVALTCSDMSKVDGYGMCGTHEDLRRLRDRITSYLGDGGAISVAYSSGIVDSLTSALLGLKGFIVELSYKDGTVKEVLVRNFNEDRNELIVLDFYEATDSVGRTPYGVDLDLLARILVV